ncbi:MAG: YceD family protein [Gammaproteobacteria bacterium]
MRAGPLPIRLAGQVSLDAMPRLRDVLADSGGEAAVELQALGEAGHKIVRGQARAALDLICQRCFGNMKFPVTVDFNLMWVRSEDDTARLPEAYEPLVSATGNVKLIELVEDELLLALPMVALHAPSTNCSRNVPRAAPRHKQKSTGAAPARPFAALKALKRH